MNLAVVGAAMRRRTEELEKARPRTVASGQLARELEALRRDETRARRASAEAEIRAAYAKADAEAAVIRARYRRAKDDDERRAATLLRGA
jgi:hypothetical protein